MLNSRVLNFKKLSFIALTLSLLTTMLSATEASASNLQVSMALKLNNQNIPNVIAFYFLDNLPTVSEKLKSVTPSVNGLINIDLQDGRNFVAITNPNQVTDTYFATFIVEDGQLTEFIDNTPNDASDHATLSITGSYTGIVDRKNSIYALQAEIFERLKSNSSKLEVNGVANLMQSYSAKLDAYSSKVEEMKQIYADAISATSEDLSGYKQVMELLVGNQPTSQVNATRYVLGLNNDPDTLASVSAFATSAAYRYSIYNSRVLGVFAWLAPFKDSMWRMNTAAVNEVNNSTQDTNNQQDLIGQISTFVADAQEKFDVLVTKYEVSDEDASKIMDYLDSINDPDLEKLEEISTLASKLDSQLNDYELGLQLNANLVKQILAKIDSLPAQKNALITISNQLDSIWTEVDLQNVSGKVSELKKLGTKLAAVNSSTKSTITCIKGKSAKKVTAVNPKCPAGYKAK